MGNHAEVTEILGDGVDRPIKGPNYSVSQKNPPCGFLTFFPNGWEFFNQFLHTYYTFLSTLDYLFLFNISNFDEVMPYYKRDHPTNFYISLEV